MISGKYPGKDTFIFSFIIQITGFLQCLPEHSFFNFLFSFIPWRIQETKILQLQ